MSSERVVAVVGNPRAASRTATVAEFVARHLSDVLALDCDPDVLDLAEHGRSLVKWNDPEITRLKDRVLSAAALVVASPTYKATYTGLLKVFLDHFDAGELAGVVTVPIMTGGSSLHGLAVDVHLVPLLVELGASCPVRGLFLAGQEIDDPRPVVDAWALRSQVILARSLSR